MPVCRTCMGEYARQEALCPSCEQPLGRGVNLCHQCGAETGGKRLCPRCKSDVSVWEEENISLLVFVIKRASYTLFPSLLAVAAWLFFWMPHGETLHHWVVTVVAVAVSLLVILILCMKRLFWRERWWASEVYAKSSPMLSLSFLITLAFSLAIVFGVVCFVLHKWWQVPENFGQQLTFGMFYVATYVFFTAGLTLFAIHSYADDLDQRAPQPIFVNTERLLRVVVENVVKTLHVSNGVSVDPYLASEESLSHEILEVVRNVEDGGVHVLFREREQVPATKGLSTASDRWVEKIWSVDADRWGRIRALNPGWLEIDKKR